MSEHPGKRGCYVRGCRQPQCIAANSSWRRGYDLDRKGRGQRFPSEERAYHAHYMREWRYRTRNRTNRNTGTQGTNPATNRATNLATEVQL